MSPQSSGASAHECLPERGAEVRHGSGDRAICSGETSCHTGTARAHHYNDEHGWWRKSDSERGGGETMSFLEGVMIIRVFSSFSLFTHLFLCAEIRKSV